MYLCFDVGGTQIKYGILDAAGILHEPGAFPTPQADGSRTIPAALAALALRLRERHALQAVGISTAGLVDPEQGEIRYATDNIPGYTGARLAHVIREQTGLPCWVENDVQAAALGEIWQGAAQGVQNLVCITYGTGVGGAIVMAGRPLRGANGMAGWLGHLVVNEGGLPCTCGQVGCYEQYASTAALVRQYSRARGEAEAAFTGKEVFDLVRQGDPVALQVYDRFLDHVVTGLVSVACAFDPGLILLGGGISAESDLFVARVAERFRSRAVPAVAATAIRAMALGNDAGLYGAGYLCATRL